MAPALYLRAVRKRWLIVAALALAGAVVVWAVLWGQSPRYEARAEVLISFAEDPTGAATPQIRQLQRQIVKTYAHVPNTEQATRPVVRALGLPYSPAALAGHIRTVSPVDSNVIDIWATDSQPLRARDIANAIANSLVTIAAADKAAQIALSPRISVTQTAVASSQPLSNWWQVRVFVGLLGGAGLGTGFVTFRYVLERRDDRPWQWMAARYSVLAAGFRTLSRRTDVGL